VRWARSVWTKVAHGWITGISLRKPPRSPLRSPFLRNRKDDLKPRSAVGTTRDRNRAAVVSDNPFRDGKPEPRTFAFFLGGEKRVPDALLKLLGDAGAVILNHAIDRSVS